MEAVFQLFVFQFSFISQLDVSNLALERHQLFIFIQQQLAGADGILFPALRQYLFVGRHCHLDFSKSDIQ
jgi:hypothetical protein